MSVVLRVYSHVLYHRPMFTTAFSTGSFHLFFIFLF